MRSDSYGMLKASSVRTVTDPLRGTMQSLAVPPDLSEDLCLLTLSRELDALTYRRRDVYPRRRFDPTRPPYLARQLPYADHKKTRFRSRVSR
ncbi:hypothetical protein Pden_0101 [Paracoccus denitrificans PD1222]|uniref:Uncharacterized protein n=1 Tax=Paracoccus denitrificans (strain Pd 1222) TaxID=318586 RepID=A1AY74_PARDP|nr:hypothetical protein Pden_0101 [Paracoccus denitrificans PD1222]